MVKEKKISKIIKMFVFSIVCLMFMSKPTYASTYFIRALLDEGNFGIVCQVISDKGDTVGTDGNAGYLEKSQGYDFSAISDYTKVRQRDENTSDSVPGSSLIANIVNTAGEADTVYKKLKDQSDANKPLVFSFPGIVDGTVKYKALSSDMARAELVANTLSKGLNDALAFIKTYIGAEYIGEEGLRHILAQLARITSQFDASESSIGFDTGSNAGNKKFTVGLVHSKGLTVIDKGKKAGDELTPINGLRYKDYVYISTTNRAGETVYGYYPWRMQKGYRSGQPLYNLITKDYQGKSGEENEYITWGQLIIQAGVNADVKGTNTADTAMDGMTLVGQGLGADLTSTITSVRSMLNLAPIQELILNMDARTNTHHMGVMTYEMYGTAKQVYVLVLVVSLLFLSTLIVKMIHQKMISTTNIIAKTSLMEGLQDVIFVGVMLAFFPTIFEIMLELNHWIVQTFSFSDSYLRAYGLSTSKVLSTETMAGFIVSSMFLSIDVYINTTYLVRAIVVSFLFAISPVLTVSYCWGPMQKKLYFSYMRELVGNIFMQSFHAITMTFFSGYNSTNMSSMEAIASAYCFIPVTQLFRQLVIGNSGGFSESLGGKLAGQLTNTAMGMHKSSVAMKQSQQMLELEANNSKNISSANMWTQLGAAGVDIAGSTINGFIAGSGGGELQRSGANGSNGNKAGGGKGGVGRALLGAAAQGAIGAGATFLGGNHMADKHAAANESLGKMQMQHSIDNIGIGLAQAGAGIGMSSFDAAAGNAAVSGGMSSVQAASTKYGQGAGNAGEGGQAFADAKGYDTAGMIGRTAAFGLGHSLSRVQDNYLKEKADANKQARKEDTRGVDKYNKEKPNYSNTANLMGMTDVSGGKLTDVTCPIEKIEAHSNNTDSSTIVFNAQKLDNLNQDDSMTKLLEAVRNNVDAKNIMDVPQVKQALENAHRDYGVSKDTMPNIVRGENGEVQSIAIAVEKMSRFGVEVDSGGNTYTTSAAMNGVPKES